MNMYKKKLIVLSKNNAKERIHNVAIKVNELSQTLKAKVAEYHYLLIQSVIKNQEKIGSLRRKNISFVNSMRLKQHQVKESTSKLQLLVLNEVLLILRTLH